MSKIALRAQNYQMRIGQLAKAAGVNIQTIRFYERQLLLPQAARTSSGYRAYSPHELEKVVFIRRMQHLGFTLKEIKELMELHNSILTVSKSKAPVSAKSRKILNIKRDKFAQMDDKLATLRTMKANLKNMLAQLEASSDKCPVSRTPPKI